MAKYTEDEFDEYLNEFHKTYEIEGVVLYPADILKSTDPIAYREAYNNMSDSVERLESDNEDDEDNDDDEDDSDNECEGHESLKGDMMGESDFCDGSCKR